MASVISVPQIHLRDFWLRRGTSLPYLGPAKKQQLQLSELGNAAARETFVTSTLPFATIWTDLFSNMLVPKNHELRWRQNGLGIGRDARIAYSGLLGRYVARAYLENKEAVRILVPLDEAKRVLFGTPYRIVKDPPGRGLEADWIGINNRGLVIVEAKGSFDNGIRTWYGPEYIPSTLRTAFKQANRTVVRNMHTGTNLSSQRWAIASRWATEDNGLEPVLLAWSSDIQLLDNNGFRMIATLLKRVDVKSILRGLGHTDVYEKMSNLNPLKQVPRSIRLSVGKQILEPGFAAMIGPTDVQPLHTEDDLDCVRRIRDLNVKVAIASLSYRYVSTVIRKDIWPNENFSRNLDSSYSSEYTYTQAGLSVVWLQDSDEISLIKD